MGDPRQSSFKFDELEDLYKQLSDILERCKSFNIGDRYAIRLRRIENEARSSMKAAREWWNNGTARENEAGFLNQLYIYAQALLDFKNEATDFEDLFQAQAHVERVAQAAFANKEVSFQEAEDFHKGMADRHGFLAVTVIMLTCLSTFVVFSDPPRGSFTSPVPWIFFGLARVSFLLFGAWAVRYLIGVHRAHSEQAISYRDRRTALSVAEILFKISDSNEERKEILTGLLKAYLDFGRNSFTSIKDRGPLPNHKQVKELAESLKPLLELAKTSEGEPKKGPAAPTAGA